MEASAGRARIALVGAFALEGLTKVINLVGALNPGNIGTYEGANILVAKIFGVTATAGLTLALCRQHHLLGRSRGHVPDPHEQGQVGAAK